MFKRFLPQLIFIQRVLTGKYVTDYYKGKIHSILNIKTKILLHLSKGTLRNWLWIRSE